MPINLSDNDIHVETKTLVICSRCGATFEVNPPDKSHDLAAWSQEAFEEKVRVEQECPKCKHVNVVYWG